MTSTTPLLTNTIVDIRRMSRRSYGSPRVHAELRLGQKTRCSKKRVERLMRQANISGIYRRRTRVAPGEIRQSSLPMTWSIGLRSRQTGSGSG